MNGINWGSIADWASAGGSVLAAVTALYLARSAERVSMSAYCGYRVAVDDEKQTQIVVIVVTNTGQRPFKISNVSISHGLFNRNHGVIKLNQASEFSEKLLKPLNDGDSTYFGVPLETGWVAQMKQECRGWLDVFTLRITIHCTNGQKKRIRPESPLRKLILDGVRKRTSDRN
ncbi:hypothetical protein ACCE15_09235 [Pseudomonas parafulva]|uniref:hypothetical protein n=1 Tax=Pseudomonas parafulva TaxID=157782 RepID=UPI0035638B37